jgi:hypothetical protein
MRNITLEKPKNPAASDASRVRLPDTRDDR